MNNLQQQILNDLEGLPETMQAETLDFVQFLKAKLARHQPDTANQPNGAAIAEIMERMAARSALSDIKDARQWQRDTREDRPLPGWDEKNLNELFTITNEYKGESCHSLLR